MPVTLLASVKQQTLSMELLNVVMLIVRKLTGDRSTITALLTISMLTLAQMKSPTVKVQTLSVVKVLPTNKSTTSIRDGMASDNANL
mmetsp:Transcript_10909/g.20388  ORF Transcript_10909/g.20388 Transcript_10909/m.20388 type:complete len:87 (-) Transcript_10909:96-356(-)